MSKDLVPSITVVDGKISDNLANVEIKVKEIAKRYTGMVVTDIKEAKTTLADLRKLHKAINDERIRAEKVYLEPFEAIKERVDKLRDLINTPISEIDEQVKDAEKLVKEDREKEIEELVNKAMLALEFDEPMTGFFNEADWRINPKWTQESYWTAKGNPSTKLGDEIRDVAKKCKDGVSTILSVAGEFTDQVLDSFKKAGDLGVALGSLERMKKAKAEAEKFKAPEPPKVEPRVEPKVEPVVSPPEPTLPSFMQEDAIPAFMQDSAVAQAPEPTDGKKTFVIKVVCSDADFQKVKTAFALTKVSYLVVESY